jgi:hypothetical protein
MPKAHVLQRFMDEDQPGVWSVEVVDRFGDGEMEMTVFYGPYSEIRARQYAALAEREPFPEPPPAPGRIEN